MFAYEADQARQQFWRSKLRSATYQAVLSEILLADDAVISVEKSVHGMGESGALLSGQVVWWVYDHLSYVALDHWLELFLAFRRGAIESLAAKRRLRIVSPAPDLDLLLARKYGSYTFVELRQQLYMVDGSVGYPEQTALYPVGGTEDRLAPFADFEPADQERIRVALEDPACGCEMCRVLR